MPSWSIISCRSWSADMVAGAEFGVACEIDCAVTSKEDNSTTKAADTAPASEFAIRPYLRVELLLEEAGFMRALDGILRTQREDKFIACCANLIVSGNLRQNRGKPIEKAWFTAPVPT